MHFESRVVDFPQTGHILPEINGNYCEEGVSEQVKDRQMCPCD